MYLSRLNLDIKARNTIIKLDSPRKVHGIIEACFPNIKERNLWRLDYNTNSTYLFIMSQSKPDFSNISSEVTLCENNAIATKSMDNMLNSLQNGQQWHFRLKANPIHSIKTEDAKKRGKVVAHLTVEYQRKWLLDKQEKYGFKINQKEINVENSNNITVYDFDVVNTSWIDFNKYAGEGKKHRVKVATATYEGKLIITNADIFKKALINGFGRAKAYGCGLMTLAYPH